jgi:uncharacterized protein (DUF4415 family)
MTKKSAASARSSRRAARGPVSDPYRKIGSNLKKVDAHVLTRGEMDEIPELTDDLMAGADLYHGQKLIRRGRPPQHGRTKQQVTLRLAPDVLERFKAGGAGWQVRIEDTLRTAIKRGLVEGFSTRSTAQTGSKRAAASGVMQATKSEAKRSASSTAGKGGSKHSASSSALRAGKGGSKSSKASAGSRTSSSRKPAAGRRPRETKS